MIAGCCVWCSVCTAGVVGGGCFQATARVAGNRSRYSLSYQVVSWLGAELVLVLLCLAIAAYGFIIDYVVAVGPGPEGLVAVTAAALTLAHLVILLTGKLIREQVKQVLWT